MHGNYSLKRLEINGDSIHVGPVYKEMATTIKPLDMTRHMGNTPSSFLDPPSSPPRDYPVSALLFQGCNLNS